MSQLTITKLNGEAPEELGEFIEKSKVSNLAHALEWHRAFSEAYGHKSVCMIARENKRIVGFLPAFFIQRLFVGSVMTSMPFLDYGGPCAESDAVKNALLKALREEAITRGAKQVEIRSLQPLPVSAPENLDKVTLILDLPEDPEGLWKNLNAKVRNQVRKAEKNDLKVEFGGIEFLSEFYNIWAINMRDLGSPPHSLQFFHEILSAFKENAYIALIRQQNITIGGLLAIKHENTVAVPWASSLREYFKLCPNMLIYWEVIRRACEEGYKKFDFGRSTRNVGTYKFKKQWGAQEHQLYWYTIPLYTQKTPTNGVHKNGSLAVAVWKRLPVMVSNTVGPKVRKYLTQ